MGVVYYRAKRQRESEIPSRDASMDVQRIIFRLLAGLAILGLVVLFGCGGGKLGPQFQPEISNIADNFQFQATGVTNVTQNLQYTWQNTGTVANVNQACSITGGTATLTIRDGGGTQVYSKNLSENGTFVTSAGTTGGWTIIVSLSNLNGTLNFRVQKRP